VSNYLNFLIDENLTPGLAEVARGRGLGALHANWAKLTSKKDSPVARYALEHDMIMVTNNLVDFEQIYQSIEIHPGLVFLTVDNYAMMYKETQIMMFEHALDNIEQEGEPINQAVMVTMYEDIEDEDAAYINVDRYELPNLDVKPKQRKKKMRRLF
jgi:predicted nuclease of predicted toxin-antitoxin system